MPRPARLARRIWRRRRPQPAHRQCPWRQGHERVAPPARRDRKLYPRTLVGADQGPRLALWRVGLADVRSRERGARGRRNHRRQHQGAERKSVVKGKSVEVSVDLGGRRIIKKKKKNEKRS